MLELAWGWLLGRLDDGGGNGSDLMETVDELSGGLMCGRLEWVEHYVFLLCLSTTSTNEILIHHGRSYG